MSPRKLDICAAPQQPRRPLLPLPESAALKAPHFPGGAFAFPSPGLVDITPDDSSLPSLIQSFNQSISGTISQREYEPHQVSVLDAL